MTEDVDLLHARLQKSFDAVKQACARWFSSVADMSAVLDSWSSLFEEYYCASLVDIETTPLSVHSDIDILTMSKTNRRLMRMLDELKNQQYVINVKSTRLRLHFNIIGVSFKVLNLVKSKGKG